MLIHFSKKKIIEKKLVVSVLALFQNSFKTTKIMRQGKTDSIELCTIFPFMFFCH